MTAIHVKNLTKTYKDVVAVDDLSLDIEQGELFACGDTFGISGRNRIPGHGVFQNRQRFDDR